MSATPKKLERAYEELARAENRGRDDTVTWIRGIIETHAGHGDAGCVAILDLILEEIAAGLP